MNNTETKVQLLEKLIQKGFKYCLYKDQNLHFYTLIIDNPEFVKSKVAEQFGWELDELDGDGLKSVKFLVEVQEDFSTAQWTFIDGLNDFYVFKSLEEFMEYLDELPNALEVV